MSIILEPCKLCMQIIPLDPRRSMRPDIDANAVVQLAYRGYTFVVNEQQNPEKFTRTCSALFKDVPYLSMPNTPDGSYRVVSSGDIKNGTLGSMPQILQVLSNAAAYGIPVVIQPDFRQLSAELQQLCPFLRKADYSTMPVGYFTAVKNFLLAYRFMDGVQFEVTDWLPFRHTINMEGAFTCFSTLDPTRIANGFVAATPLN